MIEAYAVAHVYSKHGKNGILFENVTGRKILPGGELSQMVGSSVKTARDIQLASGRLVSVSKSSMITKQVGVYAALTRLVYEQTGQHFSPNAILIKHYTKSSGNESYYFSGAFHEYYEKDNHDVMPIITNLEDIEKFSDENVRPLEVLSSKEINWSVEGEQKIPALEYIEIIDRLKRA